MKSKKNIFTFYKGGLGNQFFQYFFSLSLAKKYNGEVFFIRNPINLFNIKRNLIITDFIRINSCNLYQISKKLIKSNNLLDIQFLHEKRQFKFQQYYLKKNNICIFGYWQSFKYLKDIKVEFDKKKFSNNFIVNNKLKKIEKKINENSSVSIHFRRGYSLESKKTLEYHGVLNFGYYKKSISSIISNVSNPHFFLFSDDINWLKKNISNLIEPGLNYSIIETSNQSLDFYYMSLCKYNIIANSSYSWWAAYLNTFRNKIVISPKNWLVRKIDTSDLIPSNWIQI